MPRQDDPKKPEKRGQPVSHREHANALEEWLTGQRVLASVRQRSGQALWIRNTAGVYTPLDGKPQDHDWLISLSMGDRLLQLSRGRTPQPGPAHPRLAPGTGLSAGGWPLVEAAEWGQPT